ncbi:hypothetical protein QE373_001506 [Stenotrophomonas sp. SORGH_AS321]|nr:hypothetical protein [Stenotrophomonas sp. SORGH_AS_0321]
MQRPNAAAVRASPRTSPTAEASVSGLRSARHGATAMATAQAKATACWAGCWRGGMAVQDTPQVRPCRVAFRIHAKRRSCPAIPPRLRQVHGGRGTFGATAFLYSLSRGGPPPEPVRGRAGRLCGALSGRSREEPHGRTCACPAQPPGSANPQMQSESSPPRGGFTRSTHPLPATRNRAGARSPPKRPTSAGRPLPWRPPRSRWTRNRTRRRWPCHPATGPARWRY